MTQFTPTAHAVLAVVFRNPNTKLNFEMKRSVPNAQAQSALDELTAAGVLDRVDADTGAVSYALTEAGKAMDRTAPGADFNEKTNFLRQHGKFSLTAPNPDYRAEAEDALAM